MSLFSEILSLKRQNEELKQLVQAQQIQLNTIAAEQTEMAANMAELLKAVGGDDITGIKAKIEE